MRIIFTLAAIGFVSNAFAYDLKNLSRQDVLTLGAGLDELPRKMGDANNLWARLQQQINEQDAKALADENAARDAEIRKKIEVEKAQAPIPPAKTEEPAK